MVSDACCGCDAASRASLQKSQRRVLTWVMVINVLSCILVLAGALYSDSNSLLSGGLDNFGDALTYALSLLVVGASLRAQAWVALFKACLIFAAAMAVGVRIGWFVWYPGTPLFDAMGLVALANLAANGLCLALLAPHRHANINMTSVWECSRNDVIEGVAVVLAAVGVWYVASGWPDLLVAGLLLLVFLRSALRVWRSALAALRDAQPQVH